MIQARAYNAPPTHASVIICVNISRRSFLENTSDYVIMNPWVQFLKDNRDKGLSITQLRDMYSADHEGAPVVYNYNDTADDKVDSVLEEVLHEYDISTINQKLNDNDELTEEEEEAWKLAFELAITDEYTLTKDQLLSSHDAWINAMDYIDEMDLDIIVDNLRKGRHTDIYNFMDDVMNSFTVEQLHSIQLAELQ